MGNPLRALRFQIQKEAENEFEKFQILETEQGHKNEIRNMLRKIFKKIVIPEHSENLLEWQKHNNNELLWFSVHYWSEYFNIRIREMFEQKPAGISEKLDERTTPWFWDKHYSMDALTLFFDYYHPESLIFQLIFIRSKKDDLNEPIAIQFTDEIKTDSPYYGYEYINIPKPLLEIPDDNFKKLINEFQNLNNKRESNVILKSIKKKKLDWQRENEDFFYSSFEKYKTLLSSVNNTKAQKILEIINFLDNYKNRIKEDKKYFDVINKCKKYFTETLCIDDLKDDDIVQFIFSYVLFRIKEDDNLFSWNWLYYIPTEALHYNGGGISFVTKNQLTYNELHEFQSLTNNILNFSAIKEAQEKYALPLREDKDGSYKDTYGTILLDKLNELHKSYESSGSDLHDWEERVFYAINEFQDTAIHRNQLIGQKMISKEISIFYDQIMPVLGIQEDLLHLIKRALEFEDRLEEIKGYRQHFIHSFHVFLLGFYIIEKLMYDKHGILKDIIPSSLLNNNDPKKLIQAWLLSSLVHDVTYPIEKMNDWIDEFIKKLLGKNDDKKERKELIPININMGNLLTIDDYLYCLTRILSENLCNKENIKDIKERIGFERNLVHQLLEKRDHGLLSSLFLLSRLWSTGTVEDDVLMWSSLMVAYHTFCNYCMKKSGKKSGKTCNTCNNKKDAKMLFLPYFFEYCDNVQQWGRPESRKNENEKQFAKISLDKITFENNRVECALDYKTEKSIESETIIKKYFIDKTHKWNKKDMSGIYKYIISITVNGGDPRPVEW